MKNLMKTMIVLQALVLLGFPECGYGESNAKPVLAKPLANGIIFDGDLSIAVAAIKRDPSSTTVWLAFRKLSEGGPASRVSRTVFTFRFYLRIIDDRDNKYESSYIDVGNWGSSVYTLKGEPPDLVHLPCGFTWIAPVTIRRIPAIAPISKVELIRKRGGLSSELDFGKPTLPNLEFDIKRELLLSPGDEVQVDKHLTFRVGELRLQRHVQGMEIVLPLTVKNHDYNAHSMFEFVPIIQLVDARLIRLAGTKGPHVNALSTVNYDLKVRLEREDAPPFILLLYRKWGYAGESPHFYRFVRIRPASAAASRESVHKQEATFPKPDELQHSSKEQLVDGLGNLQRAMMKKIQMEVDVTAQCFTSVKEYRRAKLLADVLRPVLRVLQGTLSVLSKIGDTATLSGQVNTSLANAQYVSEATSLFFMVNGLRESGEKLYYAIDDTAGYVRTVKDMLEAADQTTVIRMDPRAYKQVIKQYLDSEQGTPLVIARTSELAPDKKPAKGALVLYKTIREEFRTLIDQIQRSELPQDFPLQDAVAEIQQLEHQIVEAGVHNIDVHYSIYHQGRKVHQSRKLGAVAEHNKAFAQVAGSLAKRLDIEIYAECAQLAATGTDAAYIVTYNVPGAGEAVKVIHQVSLLPQIVIEGKKMFTVDPEQQFYQMPQEMLFSLAIEFSNLWRIADDTVLSLTELLEETGSQVPPGEVQPVPTSTKQKKPAKKIEKQVEKTIKSLLDRLLKKKP